MILDLQQGRVGDVHIVRGIVIPFGKLDQIVAGIQGHDLHPVQRGTIHGLQPGLDAGRIVRRRGVRAETDCAAVDHAVGRIGVFQSKCAGRPPGPLPLTPPVMESSWTSPWLPNSRKLNWPKIVPPALVLAAAAGRKMRSSWLVK